MYAEGTHVCMLPQEPKYYDLPPTAGFHLHLLYKIRLTMLPCAWHHGSALFARSQRRLQRERGRQLRGRWFIWHPYSPIKFYWDCLTMALTFVSFLYMPLQVFFNCPNPYDPFILISDGFTFLNIGTNFITGQDHEDGKEVTLEPKTIAKQYLSRLFILDLISALPLQCFPLFKDCNHPTHTVWLILKVFRIISMNKKWKNFHKQIGLSYVHTVAITVFARILFFFHWMTYIHYQVPTFCFHYFKRDPQTFYWFERLRVTEYGIVSSVFQKYTSNLYYVCGMCNGSGRHTPVDKYSVPEMAMNSIMGLLGFVFITYTFTTLLRLAIYSRFEMFLYSGRLKELTDYMLFKKLPKSLQHKIQLFINYKFYEHYFNEQAIMTTINEQIKQDINMHCCKKLVVNVPLFQDMPVALINTIVFSMIQVLYMPGELVVNCDEPGHSIYFISSGTVAVINSNGREVAHLRDGAYFGESALLDPGVLRTVTIIALEITEIYTLNAKDFTSCLQPYPHLKRRLEESSKGNMGKRRSRNKYAK